MEDIIIFNCVFMKAPDKYMGYCPELNISVENETIQGAQKDMADGVSSFLKDAKKDRQLEKVLKEAGYTKKAEAWEPPSLVEGSWGGKVNV